MTKHEIASTLISNYAQNQFGHKAKNFAFCSTDVGIFSLQRTKRGGYFLRHTKDGKTYRAYTHPTRALRPERLAYDIVKLLYARSGVTNVSNVVKL